MCTNTKFKRALRTAWKKHPNTLIISFLLTLGGLAALGYSAYYLIQSSASTSSTSIISLLHSSSSSSSTGSSRKSSSSSAHGSSSLHSSSSSSTGSHHLSSSSNKAISSSSSGSNSISSSSTGSSSSGSGGLYYINAATSTQGYFGIGTTGTNGVIQVSMPTVNRFSQQDYGFYFFNPLYTGYWGGSFNFYSNQTIYNLTVIYNTYSNSVPSILIMLNAPQTATPLGLEYYVFYEPLPVYQGTVDIDGKCGSVSVTTTSGYLVLTALNNTFTRPQRTYCTVLTSSVSNTTVVPPSLKNPYAYSGSAFPGDVNYNGCAVNKGDYRTQIHYTAANSNVAAQTQIFVSFGLPSTATFMNSNQINTQICAPLGYCELFNSPCSWNTSYCYSLNTTAYQCICNPGFTGPPNCTHNTILQLNMPAVNTLSPIDTNSRPFTEWEEPGQNFNFYNEYINNGFIIYESSNPAGLQLTGFKGCHFVLPPAYNVMPTQNEYCMEINSRSLLNGADDVYAYYYGYTPPNTFAVFVANPGVYANTISGYTTIVNVQHNPLDYEYGFWPLLSFQTIPPQKNGRSATVFHVFGNGTYCEVYNENAVLTFPSQVGTSTASELTGSYYYTTALKFTIPQDATIVQFVSVPFAVSSSSPPNVLNVNWLVSGFNQSDLASTYALDQGTTTSPYFDFNYWSGCITVPLSNISHAGDTIYMAFSSNYLFQISITDVNYGPFLSYSVIPGYCELNSNANPCLHGGTCLSQSETDYVCRCASGYNGTICDM